MISRLRNVYCIYLTFHYCYVAKYYEIEEKLLKEFKQAYNRGEVENMAKCANTLLPFKVSIFYLRSV